MEINKKTNNTTSENMSLLEKFKETNRKNKEAAREKAEFNKRRLKLIDNWLSVMTQMKKYNSYYDTFELIDEKETNYGWRFKLKNATGLTFDYLEALTPYIRDGLGCAYFMFKIHESRKFAICDVIYSEKLTINKVPFKPYPVKPYELYFGNAVNGEPIIVNINEKPHTFLAGETGTGKNGSLNHALVSSIHHCSPKDIMFLYYQGDKGDGGFYNYCRNIYAYAENDLNKLNQMLDYVLKEALRRKKLFTNMIDTFQGDNLFAYNKLNPKNTLPYIVLVIDEFLSCTVKTSDSTAVKDLKNQIIDKLENMAQMTRSYGIVYIISHQKPEKALCPSFLKNMSSNRICFGYSDAVCSEIVLGTGDTSARDLPNRRAIFKSRDTKKLLFTTDLKGKLKEYLLAKQDKLRPDLFEDLEKEKRLKFLELQRKEDIKPSGANSKSGYGLTPQEMIRQGIVPEGDPRKWKKKEKVSKPKSNDAPKPKTNEERLIECMIKNPNYIPYNDTEKQLKDKLIKDGILRK